jgi:hypothetical protein
MTPKFKTGDAITLRGVTTNPLLIVSVRNKKGTYRIQNSSKIVASFPISVIDDQYIISVVGILKRL